MRARRHVKWDAKDDFGIVSSDAILTLCEGLVYTYSSGGVVRGPQGNGTAVLCPFDIFRTRDGAVAIAAPGENHWANLCSAMGRSELIADDRCRNNP